MILENIKAQLAEFYFTDMPCEYEFYFNPKVYISIGLVDNYLLVNLMSEIKSLIPNKRIYGGLAEGFNYDSIEPFALANSVLGKKNNDGLLALKLIEENYLKLKDVEDIKAVYDSLKNVLLNVPYHANTYAKTYQFPNMVCKGKKDFSCPATIRVNFNSYNREEVELIYTCGTDKLEASVNLDKTEGQLTLKEIVGILYVKGSTGKYRSTPHDEIVREVLGTEMRKYFIDEILKGLN